MPADSVNISITLLGGYNFINPSFSAGNILKYNNNASTVSGFTFVRNTNVNASINGLPLSPIATDGSNNLELIINSSEITPVPAGGTQVGSVSYQFFNNGFNAGNGTTNQNLPGENLTYDGTSTYVSFFTVTILACLHGSSLIETKDGLKRIDKIKEGDEVLSGNSLDEYVPVQAVAHCWLSFMGVDHDAIIFEPGSLGENEPSKRLIIDPGHPMCTKSEYLEKGYDALRPAGTFWEELKGDIIYTKKWAEISDDDVIQEETSRRYDLILEEPYKIYVANGAVVRAKGYIDHRYKRFV
jgi:hypothetical protein